MATVKSCSITPPCSSCPDCTRGGGRNRKSFYWKARGEFPASDLPCCDPLPPASVSPAARKRTVESFGLQKTLKFIDSNHNPPLALPCGPENFVYAPALLLQHQSHGQGCYETAELRHTQTSHTTVSIRSLFSTASLC